MTPNAAQNAAILVRGHNARERSSMNIRWLWFDHFPRGLELSAAERTAARRLASQHRRQDPRYRGATRKAVMLSIALILPLIFIFLAWIMWPFVIGKVFRSQLGMIINNSLSPILFNGVLWLIITYVSYRSSAPFVRRALCDLGRPVCIDCGYILTGLTAEHRNCPECGAERELMPAGGQEPDA
jgi:hypothetical protein